MTKTDNVLILTEDSIIGFGKYRGQTVSELIKNNPSYLLWVQENVPFASLSAEVLAKCYDAKPMPRFSFRLDEMKAMRKEFADLVPGEPKHKTVSYLLNLLEYLEAEFSLKKEVTIKLIKD